MAQTIVSSPFTDNRMTLTVTHNSHGFDANDIGKAVRSSGTDGQFVVARANSAANAEVVGVITSIDTANQYTITTSGFVDVVAAVPTATAGTVFFLAEADDSQLTSTEPTTVGAVSKPVAVITESNAKMLLIHYRGEVLTSTTQTNAPNDANYLVGTTNGDLSAEIVVGTTPGGELGGTWASPTIDDNIIDEANLKVSNSPTDGYFLSAQSGNTGGLTWAAPAAGAVTRDGGNTTEGSMTGTTEADLAAIASITIAALAPITFLYSGRKSSGAATYARQGLKLNTTVVSNASAQSAWHSTNTNRAEDGGAKGWLSPRLTNYLGGYSGQSRTHIPGAGAAGSLGFSDGPTSDLISAEINTFTILGRCDATGITNYCDEIQLYSFGIS